MNESSIPERAFSAPIDPNWTIEELLQWFAEYDARLSDGTLRPALRMLEETLTRTRWTYELNASLSGTRLTREPAIISLVRSIVLHIQSQPTLRARTLASLISDEVIMTGQSAAAAGFDSLRSLNLAPL